MLRRKILLFLASIVGLLLVSAVVAIWLLQGVLADLDHTGVEDALVGNTSNQMAVTITQVEIELREIQLDNVRHLDPLVDDIEELKAQTATFQKEYFRSLPEAKPTVEKLDRDMENFQRQIGMLATVEDENLERLHMDAAITASISLRRDIMNIATLMREHTAREQHAAIAWFRSVVLVLAVVFLLVLNISVMVLLRMSQMVLQPVDQLVEASRRLAREEFDFRVNIKQGDEFAELATAYNHLAIRLQANETRKLETLAQTAVMLNHELNNASAIIKLQLQLLQRQSGGNAAFERCLLQINHSLARMTATVEALKRVRRIVLTDYSSDTKMLDLERSVADEVVTKV